MASMPKCILLPLPLPSLFVDFVTKSKTQLIALLFEYDMTSLVSALMITAIFTL